MGSESRITLQTFCLSLGIAFLGGFRLSVVEYGVCRSLRCSHVRCTCPLQALPRIAFLVSGHELLSVELHHSHPTRSCNFVTCCFPLTYPEWWNASSQNYHFEQLFCQESLDIELKDSFFSHKSAWVGAMYDIKALLCGYSVRGQIT